MKVIKRIDLLFFRAAPSSYQPDMPMRRPISFISVILVFILIIELIPKENLVIRCEFFEIQLRVESFLLSFALTGLLFAAALFGLVVSYVISSSGVGIVPAT